MPNNVHCSRNKTKKLKVHSLCEHVRKRYQWTYRQTVIEIRLVLTSLVYET